jgi:hypothetical protein
MATKILSTIILLLVSSSCWVGAAGSVRIVNDLPDDLYVINRTSSALMGSSSPYPTTFIAANTIRDFQTEAAADLSFYRSSDNTQTGTITPSTDIRYRIVVSESPDLAAELVWYADEDYSMTYRFKQGIVTGSLFGLGALVVRLLMLVRKPVALI